MEEPTLALVCLCLHQHEPRAPSVRFRQAAHQIEHHGEVPVELEPLPPLGHAAVVVPGHPSSPNLLQSKRDDEGFNLVEAARDLAHGNTPEMVAAAQDLVTGGQIPASRRGT